MDQRTLESLLAGLPLGAVRYFAQVGSTNDLATRWAQAGVKHLSLVVADEQTAGRGRLGRRWYTPRGAALAFSLILRPAEATDGINEEARGGAGAEPAVEQGMISRHTALGALAVCATLNAALPPIMPAQIKWPNDVVVRRRKLAGVLVEAHWQADRLENIILGIGINVAPESVPEDEKLDFPATCVEAVLDKSVDRWDLLRAVLQNLLDWLPKIYAPEFIPAWERRLAFRGEHVHIHFDERPSIEGQILGLAVDGALRLRTHAGKEIDIRSGVIRLRPSTTG